MKRPSMVVPALVALFTTFSFAASFAQSTPAPTAAPATAGAAAKSETSTKKAATSSTKSASHASTASHSSSASKASTTPMLDINSASREELAKLPTIGDALADKIIAARPYKSRKELVSKGVLTQKEYDKVHAHLTAKQN